MAIKSHRAPTRFSPEKDSDSSAKPRRYEPRQLIIAASEAMLVVIIAALATWAHHSLSTARSPAPAAAAGASPVNSASLPASMPMSVQLRAWRTEAEPSINALVTARGNIAATAAKHDIAGTAVACRTAGDAITSSRQHMPSPDPVLNAALEQAITSYQSGLSHCILGAQNQDAASLRQAAAYFNQGDTALQSAMNILERDQSVETPDSPVLFT